MGPEVERELIRKCKAGDSRFYEPLVRAYEQPGLRLALGMLGNLEDAKSALEHGAEGIGLLRTEFLYLDRQSAPDEEEQITAYSAILEVMGDRPVVVSWPRGIGAGEISR